MLITTFEKIDSSNFTWQRWRGESFVGATGLPCRYESIVSDQGKASLKSIAIGYCEGESLPCRPKLDCVGLMCWKNEIGHFWFHITKREFVEIFGLRI